MGKQRSVMQHNFAELASPNIPRSTFDRSHGHKTTFDVGKLIPIYVDEALPGDTFKLKMSAFGRLATPIFPIMDNMVIDIHFFAVPNRLLWTNWKKFCGEQQDPGDSIDYSIPVITAPSGGYLNESLFDYMGLPTQENNVDINSLPLRAYNLIYNDWYRAQDLQDSVNVPQGDGPDASGSFTVLNRNKRHDYFTSALPWPQKGESVTLPLGTSAPVLGLGKQDQTYGLSSQAAYETDGTGTTTYASAQAINPASALSNAFLEEDPNNAGFPNIRADLSSATAATINEMRQAFQVQRLLEKDARGGTRYVEVIRNHFGVANAGGDARLQRPEYLGGGSRPISVSPVAQTSSTDGTSPQGNLAALGTLGINDIGFTKSFTEHCVILGIASVRADLTYQQGIHRMWSRETRYDFYWPSLAHIGEQAILNKEIYFQNHADDDAVFGYQERFAEYRFKPSQVTGKFRSNDAASLEAWHLSQDFSSLPTLGDTFIQEDIPLDRCIAVPTEPHILFDSFFQLHCTRPMPLYGIPGLIDHF